MRPPMELMSTFKPRKDAQIMGLEVLSVALGMCLQLLAYSSPLAAGLPGLSTFHDKIKGRDIVIWSDNAGAEHSLRKGAPSIWSVDCTGFEVHSLAGSAKQWDHTCLCHAIWKHLIFLWAEAQIMRVPTEENLADLPSRFGAA